MTKQAKVKAEEERFYADIWIDSTLWRILGVGCCHQGQTLADLLLLPLLLARRPYQNQKPSHYSDWSFSAVELEFDEDMVDLMEGLLWITSVDNDDGDDKLLPSCAVWTTATRT